MNKIVHQQIKNSLILIVSLFLLSCTSKVEKGGANRFKKGVFEIPATKSIGKTIITRTDSLQIEAYSTIHSVSEKNQIKTDSVKHIDTLYITWKNNFFYTLRMKSPKKEADKAPIYVQITKITDSSYHFSAKVGFSNFKQEGVIYKIK